MPWSDEQVELWMGRVLQIGVAVAALIVFAGGIVYLVHQGGERPDYRNFHDVAPWLKTAGGIVQAVIDGHGRALIQLGVLLMIATPVMRVVFAVFAFALEKDWLYTGVSCFVLAILTYSLFFAR
jgi:uncharacterized membrane protein